MSRKGKTVGIMIAVIIILGIGLWGAWSWFSRQALPKTSGMVRLVGLKQPVEILRDEYGVAHIYGRTTSDLYFAQGYVHAQERFWQMEFQRRVAAGRLSEVFGETTLETDRYLRQFNFHGSTEKSYAMLDPQVKEIVDAYTAGVNAYIHDRAPARLGLEFAFLGLQGVDLEIEPWTPVDSMIWAEMMVFDQSDKMKTELKNLGQLAAVGQKLYQDLHPDYRADRPTIIQGEDLAQPAKAPAAIQAEFSPQDLAQIVALAYSLQVDAGLPAQLAELGLGGAGASNSFVVSGARTVTGKPILANDPHMAINLPSLWYEIGLHCIEKSASCLENFRGFSLPGVPGILIGHNDRIAWGLTNASFDSEDVFIERINPDNPNQYEVNGKWVDMELRREEIQVRGQDEPVVITVRSTRHGVVGSDVITSQRPFTYEADRPQPYALVYAWPALEPIRSLQAVALVNRAQNWEEFNQALQYFDAGKQNWIYADVDGNIGYVMPGKVPLRAKGDGTLPVPGWNDDYAWKGFIPYDQAPRVFNPKQGFIVTANNPQVREQDYPYLISKDYDMGQRAARISELILGDPDQISLADLQAFQTDNQSLHALELMPYLQALSFDDSQVDAARDRLLEWDGQATLDSAPQLLYAYFWKSLVNEIFADQLSKDLMPSGGTETEDVVYHLLQKPDNAWWDDLATPDIQERRDAILKSAFEKAYQEGVKVYGADLDRWQWGEAHTIYFQNATLGKSGISLIENLFNRGPFPVNGSESVVQKTCWSVSESFEVYCIPALRQVIDLSNLSASQMVHSVGQSGHPMSSHYDDFIEAWRTFSYHPSNWLRSDVEQGKFSLLRLEPK